MQVFKYYFKIARSSLPTAAIYLVVFLAVTLLFTLLTDPNPASFSSEKPLVSIVDNDQGVLARGLVEYMEEEAEIVSVENTEEAHKEALFFDSAAFIMTIPEGFSEQFFAGESPQLIVQTSSDTSARQADLLVQNYLRLAEVRQLAGMNQTETVDGIKQDIEARVDVQIQDDTKNFTETQKMLQFFNFEAYAVIALNILVIAAIMLSFKGSVRKRNQVGATSYDSVQRQIFAGGAVFSVIIWLFFLAMAIAFSPDIMFSGYGALYTLSSFGLSFVGLSLGYMIGALVKSNQAVSGITNVVALGMSFISGVFLPQEFLGESVLNFAKLLPVYWYVDANNTISGLATFDLASIAPIIMNIVILLGFGIGVFAVTFVTRRIFLKR